MLPALALPLAKGAGTGSCLTLALTRSHGFAQHRPASPHHPHQAGSSPRCAGALSQAHGSLSGTPLLLPSHVRSPSNNPSPSPSPSPSTSSTTPSNSPSSSSPSLSGFRCTGPVAMFSSSTKRVQPGPGQESVWDYPRPPRLEKTSKRIEIVYNGAKIADSTQAYRVLETSHPPVYYIPQSDIQMQYVRKSPGGSSFCEWKGSATYWTVSVGGKTAENVGWSYENPTASFQPIKSHIAFYCAPMDECRVAGEKAEPQPGGFYGGWVTKDVVGPFKGGQGTWGW